jgi:type IV pilus assembly protein PilM
MPNNSHPKSRPPLACEITSERVIAGRASPDRSSVESYSVRPLPPNAITPTLSAQNVVDGEALRLAIESAMAALSPRQRELTVVLPDAAVRAMLMDFEILPERQQEATPLVRFRLKKLLPFDAERAAISYQAFRSATGVKVVAAVALATVVEEYEAAFRDAGFSPGVVLPSIVAALGAVDTLQPTLVIKVDTESTSVAITDQGELRLVRTIENSKAGSMTPEQFGEVVYPLLVFFYDTYGVPIQQVLVGGTAPLELLRGTLELQTGVRVQELVSSANLGVGTSNSVPPGALAGVVGALIG